MLRSLSKYSSGKLSISEKYELGHLSGTFHNLGTNTSDQNQKNRKSNAGRHSLFNTIIDSKGSKKTSKRRSLIGVTIMDMKNIEEAMKNRILEMRCHIQVQMDQIYGDTILDEFLNSNLSSNESNENYGNNINIVENESSIKPFGKNMTSKSDKAENKDSNNENSLVKFENKSFDKEQEKENLNKIGYKYRFNSSTSIYKKNINLNLSDSLNTSADKVKKKEKDKNVSTIITGTRYKFKKSNKNNKWNQSVTIKNPACFNSFFQGKTKYIN